MGDANTAPFSAGAIRTLPGEAGVSGDGAGAIRAACRGSNVVLRDDSLDRARRSEDEPEYEELFDIEVLPPCERCGGIP